MSAMAGFDLVIEVSKQTVLHLIQANLKLAGQPLNPPFELDLPIPVGVDAYAAVMVTGMSLDLVAGQDVTLTLNFENTSILSRTPSLAITLLDGKVMIHTGLKLIDAPEMNQKALAADLGAATVTVAFSDDARWKIAAGLAGLLIDAPTLINLAESQIQTFIRSAGLQVIPNPTFTVVPGYNGSISQGRFERLMLHNIAGQAVGLFGMLLPDKPLGDPSQKTTSSIPLSQDLCVEIGADAFHRLIFCPNLAGNDPVSGLPPSCGHGSLDQGGVTFTNLSDTFIGGQINLDGTFNKSGFCYDAHGSIHAAVTLDLSVFLNKPVISAHVALDGPYIDVDVPWYCTLAEILVGPIGLVIEDSVRSSAKTSASDLQKAMSSLTGSGGLAFGTGGLAGALFDHIGINSEGIVVTGTVPVELPPPGTASIEILGSVTTSSRQRVSSGVYVVPDGCMKGSYPYLEDKRNQTGTFVVVPTLLGKPLSLEWHLECWQGFFGYSSSPKLVSGAILNGCSGTVVLDGVTTNFPMPLPGGSSVIQSVHIAYTTSSNTITLRNVRAEGNYGFILTVKATDPAGHVATARTGVSFESDVVAILGGYQEKHAECLRELLDRLKRVGIDRRVEVPPWVPVNYPDPGELVALLRFLAVQATEETDHLLLHTMLAHGSSYLRALNSREAVDAPSLVVQQGAVRQH